MFNITKIVQLLIIINMAWLMACQQKAKQPTFPVEHLYLFIENDLSSERNQKSIYRVPADGLHIEHIYDFKEGEHYWFSPNFHYVAFIDSAPINNNSAPVLTVIEMQTSQLVAQIPYITPYVRRTPGDNSVVWDPTGGKLLVDRTPLSKSGPIDWWVYDVASGLQEMLTTDTSIKLFPTWSTDGQYVAYVSTPCPDHSGACSTIGNFWDITIVDVNINMIRKVTDFSNNSIPLELGTDDELFCNLKWSLDNQYIAFENQCARSGPIYEKHRVFVVDTTDMVVKEAVKFEQPYAYAYNYEWFKTNSLLIGYTQANLYDFQTFSRGGILGFDPLSSLTTRSAELLGFNGHEVSWSPDGDAFIVFTQEPIFEIPQSMGQLPGPGVVLLGSLQGGDMTIQSESRNLPYGLYQENVTSWSADGEYVAFSSTGLHYTYRHNVVETDVFVYSIMTGELINVTEALSGLSKPIGWLVLSQE
jgi:hypothetical protein